MDHHEPSATDAESRTRAAELDARIAALDHELRSLHAARVRLAFPEEQRDTLGALAGGLLLVSALAAAAALYATHALAPAEKVAIGYGAAVAGLAYGMLGATRRGPLAQAAFGFGLAAAHATTYAAFFLPRVQVFADGGFALPLLLGLLLAILLATHLRRSGAAAAIAFGAVCATAAASAAHGALNHAGYALGIGIACAAAALLLQAHHGWRSPAWVALAGAYGTFAVYLLLGSAGVGLDDRQQLRLSLGFLGLVFLLLSTSVILGARRDRVPRRTAVLLPLVNAAACFILARLAIDRYAGGDLRAFDLALAVALGLFAVFAALRSPRRERLTEAFLAAMLLVLAWTLSTQLSEWGLWLAPAAACLAVAVLYARTGVVFLKAVNLFLLAATFAASLWAIGWKGNLAVEDYAVVTSWVVGASVPVALALAAAVYTWLVRRVPAPAGGRWLLQDTPLDVADPHMALLHAAAGALILLALTVLRLGDDPALPYIVAAEAVVVAAVGYILFAPAIRMAGVALLVAAHVVFYFYQLAPDHAPVGNYGLAYAFALAAVTFGAAIGWERHIRRVHALPRREYDAVAAIPYLLATYLAVYLLAEQLGGLYAPLAAAGLGLAVLAAAFALPYGGLKSAGLFAFAVATVLFALRLRGDGPSAPPGLFPVLLGAFLLEYAVAERILERFQRPEGPHRRIEAGARTLLVITAATLGVVALYAALPKEHLTLSLFALTAALAILAAVLREARYAWAAIPLFAVAAGRGVLYDIPKLDALPAALLAGAALLALAVVAITWLRRRKSRRPPAATPQKQATDGRTA